MKDKDIQRLIDKYLEGLTSPAEELLLARELQRTDIPKEWQAIRLMLGELTLGEAEYDEMMRPSPNLSLAGRGEDTNGKGTHSSLYEGEVGRGSVIGWFLLPIAAILLVGFFLFVRPPKKQPVVAEVQQTETQKEPQPEPSNIEQENTAQVVEKRSVPRRATKRASSGIKARLVEQQPVPRSEEASGTSTEEEQTATETEPEVHPTRNIPEVSEQYLIAAAQAQDIRSRGERLREEVALLIEQ